MPGNQRSNWVYWNDVLGRRLMAHERCKFLAERKKRTTLRLSAGTNIGVAGQGVNANIEVEKQF